MRKIFAVLLFLTLFSPTLLFAVVSPPATVARTGQTTTFAAGDDGDLNTGVVWPQPRFTAIGDGTVADNLSGLIWAGDASSPTVGSCVGGTKTWQEALDYIDCLNTNSYLGQTDWSLPNINELKTLIDIQNQNPALPVDSGFTGALLATYWSSSSYAEFTDRAWIIYSNNGRNTASIKTDLYSIWPVRKGQWSAAAISVLKTGQETSYASGDDGEVQRGMVWPEPRFTDNDDGTVTDAATGLIWLKNANCFGLKTWDEALNSANTLTSGTCELNDGSIASDWRLPNRSEFDSLIDHSAYGPALPDGHPFMDVTAESNIYWSSSTYASSTDKGWSAYLNDGCDYYLNKTELQSVWPVRSKLSRKLTVTLNGSGSVVPDVGTLNWNDDTGVGNYDLGTIVTLTANVTPGHRFIGWSGACNGIDSCIVTMATGQEVTATFATDATEATLTPDLASPQNTGTAIVLTGAATGGDSGPYEYRFWWRSTVAGSKWALGQAYSDNPSWIFDSAQLNLPAGTYYVQVDTRHIGNPVRSEAVKTLTYKLILPATNVTLVPDLSSPQSVGTSVTLTGAASGGDAGPYEYRFWWRSSIAGSTWAIGQTYSRSATWIFDTAQLGLSAGSYYIQIDTRHVGTTVKSEARKTLTYKLLVSPTDVTLLANPVTPQSAGLTVTFTGEATGGDAGPYEYRFWWRPATIGATWKVGQAYSATSTWNWDTGALGLSAGKYFIQVDTRHVGNTVKAEKIKSMTYVLQ